ncbi:SEL1-like repeat protein [Butyrivibrio sp. JL13D10]|uniref:SEL1-like repeat protein n=1 Tax=Butyrivibrio sp. JL13D10 TaxID=3236815 RepID=UPI0038B62070
MREKDESRIGIRRTVRSQYRHELKKFISEGRGHYRCRFAETAYELGDMYRKGVGGPADISQAYFYFLQAEYATMLRLQVKRDGEDEALLARIRLILTQLRRKLGYGSEKLYCSTHPFVLYQALEEGHDIMVSFRRMKSGRLKIIGARIPKAGRSECRHSRMLVTYDRFHYCELKDFVITYARNVQGYWYSADSEDCIRVDSITLVLDEFKGNRCEFYYRGKLVAYIFAEDYVVSSGRPRYIRF